MRRVIIGISSLFVLPFFLFAADSWRIDMGVSPIKYELSVPAGQSSTKTITFYNNSTTQYEIYLSAEDCTADIQVGTPKCRAITATWVDTQSLATWVSFDWPSRFIVPARSEKKISFTITPPTLADPGWHYGAIFLNNLDYGVEGGNAVKMIRRAGVLLLVNIPWKMVYDTKIGDIEIDIPLLSAWEDPRMAKLPKWRRWQEKIMQELDPRFDTPLLFDTDDFVVTFTVPVKNSGNTHILPVGRIEIFDEKGIPLEKIGKESIRTSEWVFLSERIVDYLPINDETSNVLPNSDRLFSVAWRGFAYEIVEWGKVVIKFLSPQAYYSQEETRNASVLMPWEKYRIMPVSRTLKAKMYLEYKWENAEIVPYEKEQDINIHYLSIQKWLNYGAILIIFSIIVAIWLISSLRRSAKRMELLEEEVEYLEEEVDELEKWKKLAREAIAKKIQKKHALEWGDTPVPKKRTRTKKNND